MTAYDNSKSKLLEAPRTWLVTGVAGFIGSNLLEALLKLNQRVVGLDNFSTGFQRNLDEVRSQVSREQWSNFRLIQGDICNLEDCERAMHFNSFDCDVSTTSDERFSVEIVLHQAALGSVPRSIEDPIKTNATNISGFLNMLVASRNAKVQRFVYAASSSTYGDHPALPKVEDNIGNPLSPYAVTKYVNELYAAVFTQIYEFETVGLRYFNVFGKRQTPDGAYAAVIPKWISSLIKSEPVFINGDGETSRDFCYINNAVQMNILAATTTNQIALNQVYNVALGERTTLMELYQFLHEKLTHQFPHLAVVEPIFRDFRAGDVRHSCADISKAESMLGFAPQYKVRDGLNEAMEWYIDFLSDRRQNNQIHAVKTTRRSLHGSF